MTTTPRKPLSPHAMRVASPEVQEAIRNRLRNKGIRIQDIDAMAQDVTIELLEMPNPPEDMTGLMRMARTGSNHEAIDSFRKKNTKDKHEGAPTPFADMSPRAVDPRDQVDERIDQRRKLELVNEKIADGTVSPKQAEMLMMDGAGATAVEIGRKLKLAPQTVRNELSQAKKAIRTAWEQRVIGALAFLALLLTMVYAEREAALVTAPDPLDQAIELRHQAKEACDAGNWYECADDLDAAEKLNPDGEKSAEVQELRKAIEAGEGASQ